MRSRKHACLSVENLEARLCLSTSTVSVSVTNGTLFIKDTGTDQVVLTITETAPKTFKVTDQHDFTGTFNGVFAGVNIALTGGKGDKVDIDLHGHEINKDLTIKLGDGTDSVNVQNGTVGRNLYVQTGKADDTVVLGGDKTKLAVEGSSTINLGPGATDKLVVGKDTTLKSLHAISANDVALNGVVKNSAVIDGGGLGNTVAINGRVGGDVIVTGSGVSDHTDKLSTGSKSNIEGSLIAFLGDGKDTVDLDGKIGDTLLLFTGADADTVNVGGTIGDTATIQLGGGNDIATISGRIGTGHNRGHLILDGGAGADKVTVTKSATIGGLSLINLGEGDDTFTLQDRGKHTLNAVVNGGPGTDTFVGDPGQLAHKPVNFEKFVK